MQKELLSKKRICDRCKKVIPDEMAFVVVGGTIVLRGVFGYRPPVFTCPEQAENYAKVLEMHDQCWVDTLADHGVELYDMQKVADGYAKKQKKKNASITKKTKKRRR